MADFPNSPLDDQKFEFVKSLAQSMETMGLESDRGLLLVGLSWIDERLERLLDFYLKNTGGEGDAEWLLDVRPGNRPLASLAVRTRVARCLGLIDDSTRGVIDELRGIRNTHAHGTSQFTLTQYEVDRVAKRWDPSLYPILSMPVDSDPKLSGPRGALFINIVLLSTTLGFALDQLEKGELCVKVRVPLKTKCESGDASILGEGGPSLA